MLLKLGVIYYVTIDTNIHFIYALESSLLLLFPHLPIATRHGENYLKERKPSIYVYSPSSYSYITPFLL